MKKVLETLYNIYKIEELNPEYENVLKHIISFIHKISIEQFLQNSNNDDIKEIASKSDKEFIQLIYEIAVSAYSKFSIHPDPKEALEICLLRMLAFNPIANIHENSSSVKDNVIEKKKLIK